MMNSCQIAENYTYDIHYNNYCISVITTSKDLYLRLIWIDMSKMEPTPKYVPKLPFNIMEIPCDKFLSRWCL